MYYTMLPAICLQVQILVDGNLRPFDSMKLNREFLLLAFILLIINIPFLSDSIWWLANDSSLVGTTYYTYYNEFFLNHDLVRWLPYGQYGMPADFFQIDYFPLMGYLTVLIGWAFRIKNVLLMFKLTLFLDQLLLLFGTYLLAKEFYRRKITVFFVCLGIITSSVPLIQTYWNFHIYYLLPLVIYLCLIAFKEKKPHLLWLAGTVEIFSLIGNLAYYGAFHSMIVIIFLIWFALERPPGGMLEAFRKNLVKNLIFFGLMLVTAFVFFRFWSGIFEGIYMHGRGRDPNSQVIELGNFLAHGGSLGINKFLALLQPGAENQFAKFHPDTELTLYFGLLPLVFIFYAVMAEKNRGFFAAGTVSLILFSLSLADTTFVARTIYHSYPPMQFFRYIGKMAGILRFFLIFLAGYGLERFLSDTDQETNKNILHAQPRKMIFLSALLVLTVAIGLHLGTSAGSSFSDEWIRFHRQAIFLLVVCLLLLLIPKRLKKMLGMAAVLFLLLDLWGYQRSVFASWPKHPDWPAALREVSPYNFQMERSLNFESFERSSLARIPMRSLMLLESEIHNFIHFDPCFMIFSTSFEPERPFRLINTRWRLPRTDIPADLNAFFDHPDFANFCYVLGCAVPKLRLVSQGLFAENDEKALELVKTLPSFENRVILQDVADNLRKPEALPLSPLGTAKVVSFSFNHLNIQANVRHPNGAWLYYAQTHHQGWKTWVDGKPAPILRANYAFQAIWLDPGKHVVLLSYFDGWRGVLSYVLAVFCLIFSLVVLYIMVRQAFLTRTQTS